MTSLEVYLRDVPGDVLAFKELAFDTSLDPGEGELARLSMLRYAPGD